MTTVRQTYLYFNHIYLFKNLNEIPKNQAGRSRSRDRLNQDYHRVRSRSRDQLNNEVDLAREIERDIERINMYQGKNFKFFLSKKNSQF